MRKRISGIAVILLLVIGNLIGWAYLNRPAEPVEWTGTLKSVSFSPYQADDSPIEERFPDAAEIDKDLAVVEGKVDTVRIYSALDGMELVPELAARRNLKVLAGAWLDQRNGKNEAEIRSLIQMVKNNKNVTRVIVGNESVHRGDVTSAQLTRYIRRVKEKVKVPISTAEPWYVWEKHPELAREVDFIAVHILPYWEGVAAEQSVEYLLKRYEQMKSLFPGKPIVITEVGWPSGGKMRKLAEPSLINQATFLRSFLQVADAKKIDYNVIEAFDQPWKNAIEWSVGAHWGLFDAERNAKFAFTGPVVEYKGWPWQAAAASILGALPVLWFLFRWRDIRFRGHMFFAAMVQVAATLAVWTATTPVIRDFAPSSAMMWGVLLPAQVALLVVVLISTFELTELTWTSKMRRRFLPFAPETARTRRLPKVSIHLATYNEPPDMVKLTLDSFAALEYPDFEVLIIDNNTKDPAVWKPVEEYCAKLGPRFRFYHLEPWPGYKAGALNFAHENMAPDAEIIAVVDSDYIVDKHWLLSLAPYFENPKVAWVQAPQDHREWENDPFKEMINWEYAGFFHIGMVARNEYNAIIQHGTMTMIRKATMDEVGGWGEGYICEDAELGLRFLEKGYEAVYVEQTLGRGLVPDHFTGYKRQRYRWAYGAVQILKGHWRTLLPWTKSQLSLGQKYQFVAGWLPWFADALFLIVTLAALVWSVGLAIAPTVFDFPLAEFALPTVFVFFFKLANHLFLYSTRVRCNWSQRVGSAIAGMGLTFTIGRAMLHGLFTKSIPFMRTPKCDNKPAMTRGILMAWEELALGAALWAAAGLVFWRFGFYDIDARLWALVLGVQSTPFLAAFITSMVCAVPSLAFIRQRPAALPAPQEATAKTESHTGSAPAAPA